MSAYSRPVPYPGLLVFAILFALVAPQRAVAEGASSSFAASLAAALEGGVGEWDALWSESAARDSAQRVLDARTTSLFDWTEVVVEPERGDTGDTSAVVEVLTRGTVAWNPQAYEIARAFWTLQADESEPVNRVVRREAWRLVRENRVWRAVARELLSPVEIVDARIQAGVFPAQDVLLVECTYYVRSLVDGLPAARFLLDRRSHIYDLRVDGAPAEYVRGGELGSLGLEGFSPELESSLRFPHPLARGEEVLVKFLLRSPLVHMRDDRVVTTRPIHEGPFAERVWVPLFGPRSVLESEHTTVKLEVRWPIGAFAAAELGPAAPSDLEPGAVPSAFLEEIFTRAAWTGDLRDADFRLVATGAPGPLAPREGEAAGTTALDSSPRARTALIAPLLYASSYSTRDLLSEIQEILPLDADILDELFEEGSDDAERGADDRASGGGP